MFFIAFLVKHIKYDRNITLEKRETKIDMKHQANIAKNLRCSRKMVYNFNKYKATQSNENRIKKKRFNKKKTTPFIDKWEESVK